MSPLCRAVSASMVGSGRYGKLQNLRETFLFDSISMLTGRTAVGRGVPVAPDAQWEMPFMRVRSGGLAPRLADATYEQRPVKVGGCGVQGAVA
jgi:hypothetical protein